MTDVKKEKKQRTPRNPQSILKGVLSLPLQDKIAVCRELRELIEHEVKEKHAASQEADEMMKGL